MEIYMKNYTKNTINQFASAKFIPSDEINSVITKAKNGDSGSLYRIVVSFQYLILNVAKNSGVLACAKGYEEDILSSGNLGLLKAIQNFKVSTGSSFISYAKICIRGAIYDFLNSNHEIHYSKKVIQDLNKISKGNKDGTLSQDRVEELSVYSYSVLPLYCRNDSGDEFNMCDAEGVFFYETPEIKYINKELKQIAIEMLSILQPREKFILVNYFGINCQPLSLSTIGTILNISKQRVSQIYNSAITKIQKANNQYNSYLLAA